MAANISVTIKLYAGLAPYLPSQAARNQFDMALQPGATIQEAFGSLGVPESMCHLVLINGAFVAVSERGQRTLNDGDHLAAWPPVAGG